MRSVGLPGYHGRDQLKPFEPPTNSHCRSAKVAGASPVTGAPGADRQLPLMVRQSRRSRRCGSPRAPRPSVTGGTFWPMPGWDPNSMEPA